VAGETGGIYHPVARLAPARQLSRFLPPDPVDLREPTTLSTVHRLAWWRRLPLTAQLGLVGFVVAVAWFLTARMAADRVEAEVHARNERIRVVNQVEVVATRLLVHSTALTSRARGFVLYGDEDLARRYEQSRLAFLDDVALLRTLSDSDVAMTPHLDRMTARMAQWDRNLVMPSFTLRRARGSAAFADGAAGSRLMRSGLPLVDSVRAAHTELMRVVRERQIGLQAAAETAAAEGELETFVIRAAALAIFLLLLILLMRVVSRALRQVIEGAEALDAGNYDRARLPAVLSAPNAEMARLAFTFERLAHSIETRERQLQEDIEKLKELERLKADFVSTVSHELRTPLTSMRGAIGLLLGGTVGEMPAKARELLRIALTNTDRLIRLINDILDIEKMDAGHVQIKHNRLRLRSLLDTTVAGLEGFARDGEVKLRVESGDDIDVLGDADRLIQVLTNLTSNAVKFSPKGGTVELSLAREGNQVVVSVRDHGPGIGPEFAARIFGRFQQAGGAESRKSGGTGLGLSIAKGITELHGGQIGFHNHPTGGTVFWISLPIAPAIVAAESERPGVLIVEDDASMRSILSALIEPYARPVAVADAETALRTMERETIRVIVLDHGLPGLDGLGLAKRLRADQKHRATTILVYSAHEFTPETLRDAGIRATDAFVKTRDSEALLIDRIKKELLARR
jgi:signal transduction histidine kinase/CheY-like chemotaxis protein